MAAESAPRDVGGFNGYGRDVAVGHLEYATNIVPAVPRVFTDSMVGSTMVTLGYGMYGARGTSDEQRRIGRETMGATRGRLFEAMFGSFEGFVEWYFTGQVTDADYLVDVHPDDPTIAYLRARHEAQIFYEGHEALTGVLAPTHRIALAIPAHRSAVSLLTAHSRSRGGPKGRRYAQRALSRAQADPP